MNDDGTMARLPDLVQFAQLHGLKIGTIADLIAYRRKYDHFVQRAAENRFQSHNGGDWKMIVYVNTLEYAEHIALVKGDITTPEPVLVRMHAHQYFHATCWQRRIARATCWANPCASSLRRGRGVVVVLRQARAYLRIRYRAAHVGEESTAGG